MVCSKIEEDSHWSAFHPSPGDHHTVIADNKSYWDHSALNSWYLVPCHSEQEHAPGPLDRTYSRLEVFSLEVS